MDGETDVRQRAEHVVVGDGADAEDVHVLGRVPDGVADEPPKLGEPGPAVLGGVDEGALRDAREADGAGLPVGSRLRGDHLDRHVHRRADGLVPLAIINLQFNPQKPINGFKFNHKVEIVVISVF